MGRPRKIKIPVTETPDMPHCSECGRWGAIKRPYHTEPLCAECSKPYFNRHLKAKYGAVAAAFVLMAVILIKFIF